MILNLRKVTTLTYVKHTPDQIRHIAKFYKFCDVDELLNNKKWCYVCWSCNSMFGGNMDHHLFPNSKEYTYDDIFYKED